MPFARITGRARPWLGTGLAAATVVGATSLAWLPRAAAEVPAREAVREGVSDFYTASARSVFVDGFFTNPTIPGGVKAEGGGPQTDVAQSSLDKGDANASFPYFGDVVPTLPGVASGLFGFPVPPYPFTASSNFGGAPATISYPGIALNATSRATSTVSDAVVGSPGSGATAHSEVDEAADGTITALASTGSPLTVLGPLVSVRGFESSVRVSADALGTLTRASNFVIDEISVPGLVLRIPESTPGAYPLPFPVPIPGVPAPAPIPAPPIPLPMGGQTITEPKIGFQNGSFTVSLPFAGETQEYALPAEPVIQAFEAQGVTLRYTAPQETETGLFGGVFTVEYTLPAPPENPLYNGPTPATFILGDARAEVDRAKSAVTGPAGVVPGAAPGVAPADVADAATAALPDVPIDSIAPAVPIGELSSGPAPGAAGQLPSLPGGPAPDQDAGATSAAARLVSAGLPAFVGSDFSVIYLGLVGVAVVAMAAAAVLGAKGVSA